MSHVPVEPLVKQSVDSNEHLVFITDINSPTGAHEGKRAEQKHLNEHSEESQLALCTSTILWCEMTGQVNVKPQMHY